MKVRPATEADVRCLTRLHAEAFRGTIGVLVGERYMRAFVTWFMRQPIAIALVAEADGVLVGYVLGAPDGYGPRQTRDLLPTVALGVARHLPRIATHPSFVRQLRARATNLVWRREPRSRIHDATPPGSMSLVAIGTSPAARGRGVGAALIDAFALRAAELGFARVLLDVYQDNESARRLYARTGFTSLVEDGRVIRMSREAAR